MLQRRIAPVVSAALLLGAGLVPRALAEGTCLRSGSGTVTVTGTLVQKVVPGPPNFQSVNRGDAPQVRWLIRLAATVCVSGVAVEGDEAAEVDDVRLIQLIVPPERMKSDGFLIGKRVSATGFVSTRRKEHEPAAVLLDVKTLEEAK